MYYLLYLVRILIRLKLIFSTLNLTKPFHEKTPLVFKIIERIRAPIFESI